MMQNLGLRLDKRGSHDVTLITSNGVRVELHFDLIERIKYPEIAKILMNIWETSSLMDNSNHHYIMSERVFYFYHIAHMAKHFENGGCGIRPFVDLWILHRKGFDGDELLEKGGLKAFENACLRLVHVWFCGERHDETTRMLEAYIIEGGVYGSLRNRVGVQQNKQGGKLRYLMSRIFLPYHILMHQYPALQKRRHLVPVYQVIRWLQIVFRGKIKKGLYELNASRNVSDEQDSVMSDLLLRLGLK
ncbi:MAG: nucleotidyltransferase family protein [Clostridia bacterium]|nr:nucleotidyltransferase family protein [Clostridia bacterium]